VYAGLIWQGGFDRARLVLGQAGRKPSCDRSVLRP
jgi:hypothetical protein